MCIHNMSYLFAKMQKVVVIRSFGLLIVVVDTLQNQARCECSVVGKDISVNDIVYRVNSILKEYMLYRKNVSNTVVQNIEEIDNETFNHWHAPEDGWIKINVDWAFDLKSGHGVVGVVARDHTGKLCGGTGKSVAVLDAASAKVIALKTGSKLAVEKGCNRVIIETDSAESFQEMRKEKGPFKWKTTAIFADIRKIRLQMDHCKCTWVKCQANRVADWIAKQLNRGWTWVTG
ncbi:hypothetical protein CCACVL1_05358 [Corchorus capsularis]|uniref:RNase H type-1 domain-containing protein n=1 Tax=Corchorus capsularis TaxID=210143 RepID=A0A1R3JL94_COCAP|nr:hypothetical protein CCACVL1_05358 [Corchorus capsularis]